jgi:formylglycine-generating enzyme required for sulfatase activity
MTMKRPPWLYPVLYLAGGIIISLMAFPEIRTLLPGWSLWTCIGLLLLVVVLSRIVEGRGTGTENGVSVPVDIKTATQKYLAFLAGKYRYLDIRGMGVTDRIPLKMELVDLFVPLKVRMDLPEGETWRRDNLKLAGRKIEKAEIGDIAERLSAPTPVLEKLKTEKALIVLGDPGSGKTTFLKYVALKIASGQGKSIGLGNRLPLLVPIKDFAASVSDSEVALVEFIDQHYRNLGLSVSMKPSIEDALEKGHALILLDGLDEVTDEGMRKLMVDRVASHVAAESGRGNKFIMTSRIVGYKEIRPQVDGLVECTLVDFSDEDVADFAEKWTLAIEKTASQQEDVAGFEAEREKNELLSAIHQNPGVRGLAANPLLLTILALMKRQGIVLPERRVELYKKYVETLVKSWNLARGLGRPSSNGMDPVRTMKILAPLALWLHETSPARGLVSQTVLNQKLRALFSEKGSLDPESDAQAFIADIRGETGLILARGPADFGFIHLTFQEYLAAVGIADKGQTSVKPVVDYFSTHLPEPGWREVFMLAIGYIGIVQERGEAVGEILKRLMETAKEGSGSEAILAGEAIHDMGQAGVDPAVFDDIRDRLNTICFGDRGYEPAVRAEAGRVMGNLGDKRDGVGCKDRVPDIAWCTVESGPFFMGSDKEKDSDAFGDELPGFECRLITEAYRISRYPVTVAQYQPFIDEEGYGRKEFWTPDGWKWRREKDITGPETYSEVYQTFNHPRVGVSWYEAVAYCRWLTQKSGRKIMLPTEAQWERAARHTDGRIYPWEGELGTDRCNFNKTGIGSTSAVGIFPKGNAVCGAADMAGNVWEWCRTVWRGNYEKYESQVSDDLEKKDRRVVRGGAFGYDRRSVRCACRNYSHPVNRDVNFGFRVVSPGL